MKGEDGKPCRKEVEYGRLYREAICLLIKHASKKEKREAETCEQLKRIKDKGKVDTMDMPGLQRMANEYQVINASMEKKAVKENKNAN